MPRSHWLFLASVRLRTLTQIPQKSSLVRPQKYILFHINNISLENMKDLISLRIIPKVPQAFCEISVQQCLGSNLSLAGQRSSYVSEITQNGLFLVNFIRTLGNKGGGTLSLSNTHAHTYIPRLDCH